MSRTVWVPEVPFGQGGAYRAATPRREGKLSEREVLVTADVNEALHFDTRAECMAWCDANPRPMFAPREHMLCD